MSSPPRHRLAMAACRGGLAQRRALSQSRAVAALRLGRSGVAWSVVAALRVAAMGLSPPIVALGPRDRRAGGVGARLGHCGGRQAAPPWLTLGAVAAWWPRPQRWQGKVRARRGVAWRTPPLCAPVRACVAHAPSHGVCAARRSCAEGKVALVTGAAKGIGSGIARRMALEVRCSVSSAGRPIHVAAVHSVHAHCPASQTTQTDRQTDARARAQRTSRGASTHKRRRPHAADRATAADALLAQP